MQFQQDIHGYRFADAHRADTLGHRVDVVQRLRCRNVPGLFAKLSRGVGVEQSPAPNFQPLDTGRSHALGAKKEPGQGLGVSGRRWSCVEAHECGLGIGHVGGDVTVKDEVSASQRIRPVDGTFAGTVVASGRPRGICVPPPLGQRCNENHLLIQE